MKPHIPVTLLCVDCTDKAHLARWAVERCMAVAEFAAVKFLTHAPAPDCPYAVQIPRIMSIDAYSRFMVCDAYKHVDTSHCLVVQSDGYIVDASAWSPQFLKYDYIGAPWWFNRTVGNGGFSLRSRKLMQHGARILGNNNPHPEDTYYSIAARHVFEQAGFRYPDLLTAGRFAVEGRTWQSNDWVGMRSGWQGQFGFHSWLTPLPADMERPTIFHHSGDAGDVIYALPTIKAMGGGVLFLSPDNKYPYPRPTRERPSYAWVHNLAGLLEQQDYIWRVQYSPTMPYSVDVDLNKFREKYQHANPDMWETLFRLHLKAWGAEYPEDKPWLTVDRGEAVPGYPILVNRTARFQNPYFPWRKLIERYGDKMAFIGTDAEYGAFAAMGRGIPHVPTSTLLDVARLVRGARVFIGNQSCPMAIAAGLGQNAICEGWQGNANVKFARANFKLCMDSHADIPEGWL